MEIKATHATFEQSKFLKERGFDEVCNTYYSIGGIFDMDYLPRPIPKDLFYAPEQWQVVEWLRVKHGIWVYCEIKNDKYYCKAKKLKSNWRKVISGIINNENIIYNTPQEAYSAAFDYILNNNLI